jgi:hypothetical protein
MAIETVLFTQDLIGVPAHTLEVTVGTSVVALGTALQNPVTQSSTNGAYVAPTLANFGSIVPAGSNAATATPVTALVSQLGAAAATTGVVFGTGANTLPIGDPMALLNSGTAAIHVYANGYTIDTIAGTTGVTLTNGFGCNFTAVGTAAIVSSNRGTVSS